MTLTLSDNQVRFLRRRAQRLIPQPASQVTNVAHLVNALCGIQAQDAHAAELALRVRSVGLVAADVERARVQERSIIRTWAQRGTLRLLAVEDAGWLLSLLGPVFIAGDLRRRAELGLDVLLEPFKVLAAEIQPALEAETQDIGRFLGMPVSLEMMPHL